MYGLLDRPGSVFDPTNKGNKEIIFDVQFESGINGNTEGTDGLRYFSPNSIIKGGKGHCIPTMELYNTYADNDLRKADYFIRKSNLVASNKLRATSDIVEDCGCNMVVLRYADVLLMLAECDAQLGDMAEANVYLNQIKRRAQIEQVNITDKNQLLDEIETERRKELVCEGERWFDLIRTGKAVATMNSYFKRAVGYHGVSITEANLLQPIPQSQTDTDPSLK